MAGETQSSTDVISAGNRSLVLQVELHDKTCKDKPFDTMFNVQNLNGQPVEVKGNYYLYPAKDQDFKQLEEKPVLTGTFTSNGRNNARLEESSFGPLCTESIGER